MINFSIYYYLLESINLADMLDELQEHVEAIDMANGKYVSLLSCYFSFVFHKYFSFFLM